MLAIIGGSGLTQWPSLQIRHREVMRTPYGDPSSALYFGTVAERKVVFLARHGFGQTIAAHVINHRANLWALKEQNVRAIIALSSVGSLCEHAPGDLVAPDQLIDYTKEETATFFENVQSLTHIDFSQPYAETLRTLILNTGRGVIASNAGVYAAVSGPRLETAAEANRFSRDGATLIGMSGMPEPILARELGLPYAMLTLVSRYASGHPKNNANTGLFLDAFEAGLQKMLKLLDRIAAQELPKQIDL